MDEGAACRITGWIDQIVGKPKVSDWVLVDDAMITGFADVTRDRNFLHTEAIAETQPGRYRETVEASVEIEGQERPALVATWIALYLT